MSKSTDQTSELSFDQLVESIVWWHTESVAQASRAINSTLSLRNWSIGYYLVRYELFGPDRSQYGDRLIEELARRLGEAGVSRADESDLRLYRQFYQAYSDIRETLSPEWKICSGSVLTKLSFSHIAELLTCPDPTQRAFYELECIRGNWTVRELKRQIASLYHERSGMSEDRGRLADLTQEHSEKRDALLAIRDPYVLDFLGLKSKEVMGESHLEDQLLDKIEEFLLELGHGFCFEARQKRILIGEVDNYVDLVFYHRILKCHVLVELKLSAFSHENIEQLNTYVSWYHGNMMTDGDNPPVGILLCTQGNRAFVEYAMPGIDSELFVSKYQSELPKKEDILRFIEEQLSRSYT